MSPLKSGNVVRLASGGPEMTVGEVVGNSAICLWFEELTPSVLVGGVRVWGELRTRSIRTDSLVIVR